MKEGRAFLLFLANKSASVSCVIRYKVPYNFLYKVLLKNIKEVLTFLDIFLNRLIRFPLVSVHFNSACKLFSVVSNGIELSTREHHSFTSSMFVYHSVTSLMFFHHSVTSLMFFHHSVTSSHCSFTTLCHHHSVGSTHSCAGPEQELSQLLHLREWQCKCCFTQFPCYVGKTIHCLLFTTIWVNIVKLFFPFNYLLFTIVILKNCNLFPLCFKLFLHQNFWALAERENLHVRSSYL